MGVVEEVEVGGVVEVVEALVRGDGESCDVMGEEELKKVQEVRRSERNNILNRLYLIFLVMFFLMRTDYIKK